MLCRLRGPLAASLLGLAGAPALATPAWQPQAQPITSAKPFGPGSPGFLPTCSSTFNVANALKQSGNFTNSQWSVGNIGTGTALTVAAAPGIVDPQGGHGAYSLTINAVPLSASNVSELYTGSTNISYHQGYPNTFDVWVKGAAGNSFSSNEQITSTSPEGTAIVALTGGWQRMVFQATPAGGTHYYTIGPDLRDPAQYAYYNALYNTTNGTINHGGVIPAQTVYIYGAQVVEGKVELPYSPTTTTAAYNSFVSITANCPPGVAFRNFASLQTPLPSTSTPVALTYAGVNVCQGNQSGCPGPGSGVLGYQGVGPAMINNWQAALVGGTWYGLANCINSTHSSYLWGQCTYSTTDLTQPWSYVGTAVNPGTPTNPNLAYYILHASQLPAGCTYSSTSYKYCWLVSGETTTSLNTGAISLLYTNNLSSFPYGYSTAAVINSTTLTSLNNQYAGQTDPTLPSCLLSAGTYYCYSSVADNGGVPTILYTISASADMASATWTGFDYALRPATASDWDAGYHRIDNHVHLNKHGFYEYFYTAFNGSNQYIGYAVSNSPSGPWWLQNGCPLSSNNPGCVLTKSSPWFGGTSYVGDAWVTERNGLFMLNENYDNGTNLSQGVIGFMPDY